jgi:hypothetical protein
MAAASLLSNGAKSRWYSAVHGVAFLSRNQHPEPTSSRRATPLLLFQQSPGHRGDSDRKLVAEMQDILTKHSKIPQNMLTTKFVLFLEDCAKTP